jgi:hypothetical protein
LHSINYGKGLKDEEYFAQNQNGYLR